MVLDVDPGLGSRRGKNIRTVAGLQVGTLSIVAPSTSKKRKKNREFFREIVFFLKNRVLDSDWPSARNQLSVEAADWPVNYCAIFVKDLGLKVKKVKVFVNFGDCGIAEAFLGKEINVKGCRVHSSVDKDIVFCRDIRVDSPSKKPKPAKKGNFRKSCMIWYF